MMQNKPVAWSFSALKAYVNCPRAYKETKILKKWKQPESPEQKTGIEVHGHFEHYILHDKPIPAPYTHYTPQLEALKRLPGEKYAEFQMAFTKDMTECGWKDWNTCWLRVAADYMAVPEMSPTAFVVDYKLGKSKYADTQQLKLTSIAMFTVFPHVEKVKGALLFPHEEKMIKAEFSRDMIPTYWSDFMPDYNRLLNSIATDNFPEKPSGLCGRCPVKDCPYYKGG